MNLFRTLLYFVWNTSVACPDWCLCQPVIAYVGPPGRRQQPIWESLDLGTISSEICVKIQEAKYKYDNETKMQGTQVQIHINKQNVNQFGNPWVLGPSVAKYVPGAFFWPQSARQAVICCDWSPRERQSVAYICARCVQCLSKNNWTDERTSNSLNTQLYTRAVGHEYLQSFTIPF